MASHHVVRDTQPKTEEQIKQELDKIAKYRQLEDTFREHVAHKRYDEHTFRHTSDLLRKNPEYYTAWNTRRRCLTSWLLSGPSPGSSPSTALPSSSARDTATTSSGDSLSTSSAPTQPPQPPQTTGSSGTTPELDGTHERNKQILRQELEYTIPLLMQFPKCYWIWEYRVWVLKQVIVYLQTSVARKIWEEELELVSKMLYRDRRNFHAWTYRRGVVETLESAELAGQSLAEPEFEYTTKMINYDLSNFSAWHNRSKLIPKLLNERGSDGAARREFLEKELDLVREGLNVGPEDQSLWYYHQFLVSNIAGQNNKTSFVDDLTEEERVNCVRREVTEIKDLLEDYNDIKWIYESLIEYVTVIAEVERRRLHPDELNDVSVWLQKLRDLDPQRHGRWDDFQRGLRP